MHHPTGFHLLSGNVVSDLLTSYGVRGDDEDMDDDVGGVQFYSWGDFLRSRPFVTV